jgi:hypothetical protein
VAFYRGGAKWSSVFVRRAVLRASRSFARAFWVDGKTLRDAPLVGHRGFVV